MHWLFVIAIAVVIFIIAVKCENKKFRITEYSYVTDKIGKPVTIAVLADLHNYSYGEQNSQLLEAIEAAAPDYVISAGDMVEGSGVAPGTKSTVEFLGRICEKYPFAYGCGNHEWRVLKDSKYKYADSVKVSYLEALSYEEQRLKNISESKAELIRPLDNRNILWEEDNIKIYGLNLEKDYFKKIILNKVEDKHISELVGKVDEKRLNILIGHNPEQFDAYADWGADIVLAGHNHGGMVNTPWHKGLISPRFMPFPKYDWGEYKKKNTTMFLSRGLGNHTIHIRIFNRAELMVIKIKPSKDE